MAKPSSPSFGTMTRRTFLSHAATLASAPALLSGSVAAQGVADPLRVAIIGAGGRGADNLAAIAQAGVTIVSLCDCDARQAVNAFRQFPDAARYSDWRKMLEREKSIEAVVVSTPDHNHAAVSIAAMQAGKHVYCEKPLTRSIWEAREMARVARATGVVTQMGTQGHAFEGTRRAVEFLRAGIIGEVTELHVWTDRPAGWWRQGIGRPTDTPPVPPELDWDVWLGPAPERPYNPAYVPFKWRGFWDFGTGAIGDMGIHNLDTAYWGLELGVPRLVRVKDASPALSDPRTKETGPAWSIIELQFPERAGKRAVNMTWYDGGKLPPTALFQGEPLIEKDGGSLIVGTKGTLFTRTWHGGQTANDMFVLLPRKQFADVETPSPTLPRAASHHQEWVDACRGRAQAQSPFPYAARLTEALLIGNVALRAGGSVEWDADHMRATSNAQAEGFIRPVYRAGWGW